MFIHASISSCNFQFAADEYMAKFKKKASYLLDPESCSRGVVVGPNVGQVVAVLLCVSKSKLYFRQPLFW
jgi:hypothetical protein